MPYSNFSWISDRLAIGGLVTDSDEIPFDAILSMETHAPPTIRELVQSGAVDYQWRSIIDGYSWETHDEIVRRYTEAATLLHEWHVAGKRILVHCMMGVSRSVTAVLWYLVQYERCTWDQALALVGKSRTQANPNIRFEIPLRMAAGEDLTEEWLWTRIEVWRRRIEQEYEVQVDPQQVWDDLESQGTIARLRMAVS